MPGANKIKGDLWVRLSDEDHEKFVAYVSSVKQVAIANAIQVPPVTVSSWFTRKSAFRRKKLAEIYWFFHFDEKLAFLEQYISPEELERVRALPEDDRNVARQIHPTTSIDTIAMDADPSTEQILGHYFGQLQRVYEAAPDSRKPAMLHDFSLVVMKYERQIETNPEVDKKQ